jgi:hypothetical protein
MGTDSFGDGKFYFTMHTGVQPRYNQTQVSQFIELKYQQGLVGSTHSFAPRYSSCLFGLSTTSQQYFSHQPPAINQQYFSFRTNHHQPNEQAD